MLCEVFLIGGGRIALAVLLVLLAAGIIPAPWIWLVVGLFLLTHTLDGVFAILRMREFEASKARPFGAEDELEKDEVLEHLDPKTFYDKDARRARAIAVVTWWLALPALLLAIWAWSEPVLGWVNPFDGKEVLVLIVGVVFFAFATAHPLPRKRIMRRILLTVVVVAVMFAGLWNRHPYLRPGYPDAARVKVEQLLKTPDIQAIQYHTGALVEYAHELEARGEIHKAGELLHMASMVDVTDPGLQETYASFLTRHAPAGEDALFYQRAADLRSGVALKASDEPYQLEKPEPLPLLGPDSPQGHALVLIADLQTPVELLDVVGSVLRKELGVPVYRQPQQVDFSGVEGRSGKGGDDAQIRIDHAWAALAAQIPLPRFEPRQHLVITARDLYGGNRNYLFNSTVGPAGGLVSYHRLGKREDPCKDRDLLDDLCKQALATAIKSLTIYPCPDSRDVTAYVNGPFQLERKGRHALPATLSAYRFGVDRWIAALRRAEASEKGP